ncbi:MAG: hypothetical protein MJ244_01500 [Clostridia bacterium]|nr:hypothetical protein [Clostridia bacterium]
MVKIALIAGFLTFIFAFITILGFFMVVLSPEEYISHVDAKIENVVRAKKFREDSTCNMAYYSYEMNNKTYKGSTLFNEGDALKIGDTISIAFDKIKPKRSYYKYNYFIERRRVRGGLTMVVSLVLLAAVIILAI